MPLTLDDFQRVSDRTPFICDLKPSGRYVMEDIHKVRGEGRGRERGGVGRGGKRGARGQGAERGGGNRGSAEEGGLGSCTRWHALRLDLRGNHANAWAQGLIGSDAVPDAGSDAGTGSCHHVCVCVCVS